MGCCCCRLLSYNRQCLLTTQHLIHKRAPLAPSRCRRSSGPQHTQIVGPNRLQASHPHTSSSRTPPSLSSTMGGGSSNGLSDAYDSPGNVLGLMGTADSRPEYKLPPLHSRRRHHQHFRRRHRSPPVDNVVEDDTDVQKPAALQRTPPYDAQYLMHSPQFHPHQHLSPSYPPPNYHGVSRMDDQAPDTGLSASLLQLGLDTVSGFVLVCHQRLSAR